MTAGLPRRERVNPFARGRLYLSMEAKGMEAKRMKPTMATVAGGGKEKLTPAREELS